MFPNDWMSKVTGSIPIVMKCKLDTEAGVNIMPLLMYQYVCLSEFDKQGKSIGGYGQDTSILKGYIGIYPAILLKGNF